MSAAIPVPGATVATSRWAGSRENPHAQARAARSAPLLLHSLTHFREVFAVVLAAAARDGRAPVVVEVGVESGAASAMYPELGAGAVYCVEPAPTEALRAELAGRPGVHLVEAPSPAVLGTLPVADLYVLDGDHNHATVYDELGWIMEHAPDAVVALHDVGWPWGRRDLYYEPSHVDPARRHPASDDGPTVAHDGLGPDGFVGLGAFRCARWAGGDGNGVLTAVEDRIAAAAEPWSLGVVPAVFGLGLLVRDAGPVARAAVDGTAGWTGSFLLADLENNRLALYCRVLALQQVAVRAAEETATLRAERDAAQAEIAALRAERDAALTRPARTSVMTRLRRRPRG